MNSLKWSNLLYDIFNPQSRIFSYDPRVVLFLPLDTDMRLRLGGKGASSKQFGGRGSVGVMAPICLGLREVDTGTLRV